MKNYLQYFLLNFGACGSSKILRANRRDFRFPLAHSYKCWYETPKASAALRKLQPLRFNSLFIAVSFAIVKKVKPIFVINQDKCSHVNTKFYNLLKINI